MTHMRLADFEARYRSDPDPWGYESSDYERAKYAVTLQACGSGPYEHALELGSSIGVLSAALSSRCRRLTAIDGSPTATRLARQRLEGRPVEVVLGEIPDAIGPGPFDLVLASEILYYLQQGALEQTLTRIHDATRSGAPVVAVHWRPGGPDRPFTADEVHDRLRAQKWLVSRRREATEDYLLDVLVRR